MSRQTSIHQVRYSLVIAVQSFTNTAIHISLFTMGNASSTITTFNPAKTQYSALSHMVLQHASTNPGQAGLLCQITSTHTHRLSQTLRRLWHQLLTDFSIENLRDMLTEDNHHLHISTVMLSPYSVDGSTTSIEQLAAETTRTSPLIRMAAVQSWKRLITITHRIAMCSTKSDCISLRKPNGCRQYDSLHQSLSKNSNNAESAKVQSQWISRISQTQSNVK